jgi:hypothetical protein
LDVIRQLKASQVSLTKVLVSIDVTLIDASLALVRQVCSNQTRGFV